MEALRFTTYYEEQRKIADRLIKIRKSRKISREKLSDMSGVSYASIRRFEKTGEISLSSLIKIALALQLYDDLDNLFNHKIYHSIQEVIDEQED